MPIYNPLPNNTFLPNLFSQLPSNAGNVHISVNTHLTSDLYCITLIIDAGITLFTDNWRIYCLTSLVNNGTISNNGTNGNNGTAIAGGSQANNPVNRTLRQGQNGRAGVINGLNGLSGSNLTSVIGRQGANGGDAIVQTSGLAGTPTFMVFDILGISAMLQSFYINSIISASIVNAYPNTASGSGGADAGAAGSGSAGCGAGIVFIYANTITNNGSINTIGGNAGSPFNNGVTPVGGSGGGAGGIIILIAKTIVEGTLDTTEGNGSNGVNGGTPGDAPNSGPLLLINA